MARWTEREEQVLQEIMEEVEERGVPLSTVFMEKSHEMGREVAENLLESGALSAKFLEDLFGDDLPKIMKSIRSRRKQRPPLPH